MILTGKSALVTGGSSGIGKSVVQALIQAGMANVNVISRRGSLDAATEQQGVSHIECDLSDGAATTGLASMLAATPGALDVLVHCAGSYYSGSIDETTLETIEQQLQINFKAPYLLTKLLLPKLRKAKGQIVFVNTSAITGTARGKLAAYSASKLALKALADNLRAEVNVDAVRVISIYPGRTATPMQEAIHTNEKKPYTASLLLQAEDVAASIVHALTMPSSAEITDIHIRPFRK